MRDSFTNKCGHQLMKPTLNGNSSKDWALWQLSSILAEIAEQAVRSENGGNTGTEKQTLQEGNLETVFPPIKGASDA